MIDQHAADERVQLERLYLSTVEPRTGMPAPSGVESVSLRPSVRLALSAHEQAVVLRHAARLKAWGWEIREPAAQRPFAAAAVHGSSDACASYVRDAAAMQLSLVAVPSVQSITLREPAMLEYAHALDATGGASTFPPPAVHRPSVTRADRPHATKCSRSSADPLTSSSPPSHC